MEADILLVSVPMDRTVYFPVERGHFRAVVVHIFGLQVAPFGWRWREPEVGGLVVGVNVVIVGGKEAVGQDRVPTPL